MAEYTKGELKVRVVHGRGWSVQIINTKSKLNMLQDYNLGIAEANAKELVRRWNAFETNHDVNLIAAAPDLLEAAKIGLSYIEAVVTKVPRPFGDLREDRKLVGDIIAKATRKA